jgi:hypothetical protein
LANRRRWHPSPFERLISSVFVVANSLRLRRFSTVQ